MLTELKELQCFKQDSEGAGGVTQRCKHKSNPAYAHRYTGSPSVLAGSTAPSLRNEHATTIYCQRLQAFIYKCLTFQKKKLSRKWNHLLVLKPQQLSLPLTAVLLLSGSAAKCSQRHQIFPAWAPALQFTILHLLRVMHKTNRKY